MHASRRSRARGIALAAFLAMASGCGGNLDLGSDVLWSAQFEGGTLEEWTSAPGGAVSVSPSPPGSITVSAQHARGGRYAAQFVIDAQSGAGQQDAVLARQGDLPEAAYYSAWYYLPVTVQVGGFWVISKLRRRTVADDPSTVTELFDVDLVNDPEGEMTLQVYDHRQEATVPLAAAVVVPTGVWFQIETYYRNAPDATGALTVWFDGQTVVDLEATATSSTPWVEWDVTSVGADLTPAQATLFADDCAVSRRRVGPQGRIAE
jgi:hypothetical protein